MATPNSGAAKSPGAAKIGRPAQWTKSQSRKLVRLYMFTTLPVEKIIKALFPGDSVKKNSAQKTVHKMLGHDPRRLRPDDREDMDKRVQWFHKTTSWRRKAEPSTDASSDETVPSWPRDRPQSVETDSTGNFIADGINGQDGFLFPTGDGSSRGASLSPGWHGSTGLPEGFADNVAFLPFEPRSVTRQNTTISASSTTSSIRNLKKRISGCSTVYAKQINTVLRNLTNLTSSNTDLSNPRSGTGLPVLSLTTNDHAMANASMMMPEPAFALPGDLLLVQTFVPDCHHDSRGPQCWCAISDDVSDMDLFCVTSSRELSTKAMMVYGDPSRTNLAAQDQVGNTYLHLLAALEEHQSLLLDTIPSSNTLYTLNTARQTFLHVLAPRWFADLDDVNAPLYKLLNYLNVHSPNLVYARDIYGRTFFHRLYHFLKEDPQRLQSIFGHYSAVGLSYRDAFGHRLCGLPGSANDGPFAPPRRVGTLSPLVEEADEDQQSAVHRHHAALLRTINAAHDDVNVEDGEGRNALQCLAEVELDASNLSTQPSRPPKRKRDKGSPPSDENSETVSERRFSYMLALLPQGRQGQPSVDVNHYDKEGNTVLMSFIIHLADDQGEKGKTLGKIIDALLDAGAAPEARNRHGETALLVAARLGRKTALTRLLDRPVNAHARDSHGRGLLKLIDTWVKRSTDDLQLYGRLMACLGLMTGSMDAYKLIPEPTIVEEWSVSR